MKTPDEKHIERIVKEQTTPLKKEIDQLKKELLHLRGAVESLKINPFNPFNI